MARFSLKMWMFIQWKQEQMLYDALYDYKHFFFFIGLEVEYYFFKPKAQIRYQKKKKT